MILGFDINYQNHRGETALHHAVLREYYEWALLLLQSSANPNLAETKRQDTVMQKKKKFILFVYHFFLVFFFKKKATSLGSKKR